MENVKNVIDRIIADGEVTNVEKVELEQNIWADRNVSPEEQEQLNRLQRLIDEGKVKVIEGNTKNKSGKDPNIYL